MSDRDPYDVESVGVQTKSGSNPFYAVTALLGVAFVVTTLAYVVAWVRQQPMGASPGTVELGPVLRFFNDRGEYLMIGEAILLAIVAAAAMGLDQWRSRNDRPRQTHAIDHSKSQP